MRTSPSPISNVCLPLLTEKIDSVELIIRDFPSNISCSIFFFLVPCLYVLSPLQIVLVTSSFGTGRSEIRRFGGGGLGWGYKGDRYEIYLSPQCYRV